MKVMPSRFLNSSGRAVVVLVLLSLFLMSPVMSSQARQKEDKGKPQEDISTLKKQVHDLQEAQQQILTELKELKRLLMEMQAARPAEQPPQFVTFNVHGEPFNGDAAARVAIIEYSDFECPYCGQYSRETYSKLVESYVKTGKVKYYFRDLPLSGHPNALPAARAARCAAEQGKFWEMHDSLFANQAALSPKDFVERAKKLGLDEAKFSECLSGDRHTDEIRRSISSAQRLGINGTPAFAIGTVTTDGEVVRATSAFVGGGSYEEFKAIIDELLSQQKK
ncbi:MAG: hypothetical protein DMF61_19480 [Blastocatellia bacterium AA13]|nr:MAG: hypothetical protein DMF61_19480 [Blastocatellia bacterium AA13]